MRICRLNIALMGISVVNPNPPRHIDLMKKKRCHPRTTWYTGKKMETEWCYVCGAYREVEWSGNDVVATSTWKRPNPKTI
jgi:hypothetical protein